MPVLRNETILVVDNSNLLELTLSLNYQKYPCLNLILPEQNQGLAQTPIARQATIVHVKQCLKASGLEEEVMA
tara:strand:+ start:844 stop:1062 length:219 start_codon:yes stop_codon:yes gene_type:complete